jgi:hypothetical protein
MKFPKKELKYLTIPLEEKKDKRKLAKGCDFVRAQAVRCCSNRG